VTSDVRDKTISVTVERTVRHPLYNRVVRKQKKLMAHDERNEARLGDLVEVMETRPLSKTKRWRLTKVLERAK
jgi:small subunit ribosomal protein S17